MTRISDRNRIDYYGGLLPWGRHAVRIALNRLWSRVLRRSLARAGSSFNVDFTTRILGAKCVAVGDDFYAGRGFKLVITNQEATDLLVCIGNHVGLNDFVTIAAQDHILIGNNVLIGAGVYLGNISHGRYKGLDQSLPESPPNSRPFASSGVLTIESNVWLGEDVIIPGGVTIGRGAIVGAGSVVTKDIPPYAIAAGNPARVIKKFDPKIGSWERVHSAVPRTQTLGLTEPTVLIPHL